jgi:glycine cleavage system H protein
VSLDGDPRLYTDEHEWIRVEGEEGTVGVTAFAEDQLGDVVYVELPEPGTQVTRGQAFGVIESVKAVYDLFAPATGEVVARNEALLDAPEKVNQSPYGDGWMIRVRLSQPGELDALMKPADYEAFATSER